MKLQRDDLLQLLPPFQSLGKSVTWQGKSTQGFENRFGFRGAYLFFQLPPSPPLPSPPTSCFWRLLICAFVLQRLGKLSCVQVMFFICLFIHMCIYKYTRTYMYMYIYTVTCACVRVCFNKTSILQSDLCLFPCPLSFHASPCSHSYKLWSL